MSDKRYKPRHHKRLAVRFGEQKCERMAFADNFTEDGLFLRTTTVLPPGTRLKLCLTTPVGDILAEGTVAWARRFPPQMLRLVKNAGMGIHITGFANGAEDFEKYCQQLPI